MKWDDKNKCILLTRAIAGATGFKFDAAFISNTWPAEPGEEKPTPGAVEKIWQLIRRSAKDNEELIAARAGNDDVVKNETGIKSEINNIKADVKTMDESPDTSRLSATPMTPSTPKGRVNRKPSRKSSATKVSIRTKPSRKRRRVGQDYSEESEMSENESTGSEPDVDTPLSTQRTSTRSARKTRTPQGLRTKADMSMDMNEEDEDGVGELCNFSDPDFRP